MIRIILGGARSGKSTYAQNLIHSDSVTYVATSIPFDDGMKHRIKLHQESRPKIWKTVEKYKGFSEPFDTDIVLVDCLTLMVSNLLMEAHEDFDKVSPEELQETEEHIKEEILALIECAKGKDLIIVSNEVGLGLASPYSLGNAFRDISGRMNQLVARLSDEAYFMVSGLPMRLK
ncbi:bifunctional adenosylcobinamide kinase/adenosylcobinamide-phosphate guanylyltransferase [Guggenheimella bovis]